VIVSLYLWVFSFQMFFTIVTDCNTLVYAINKANLNPQIARWTLALQNYNFRVVHRPGEKMRHVDELSRCMAYVNELPLERELEFRQLADPRIQEISRDLELRDGNRFALVDDLVYRKNGENLKFIVPDAMVYSLLSAHYDDMAHDGFEKTFRGINSNFWFPAIRKKINEYIENCFTCLMANDSVNRLEREIGLYPIPKVPLETLHVDHFGPLQQDKDHYKYILVVIDSFTRFTWLCPVKSTSSREAMEHLSSIFATFGNPTNIMSDRGTALPRENSLNS